jgi:hypothetical protein
MWENEQVVRETCLELLEGKKFLYNVPHLLMKRFEKT